MDVHILEFLHGTAATNFIVSDNYKENEKLQLWYESLNTSSFKTVDADNDDLKNAYIFKTMNKSTLSLHAAVYENLTESVASGSLVDENIKGLKKQKFWLIEKQCFSNTLKSRNPFEFLRQQNEDQRNKPEVMQFKASQQLLGSSRPSSARCMIFTSFMSKMEPFYKQNTSIEEARSELKKLKLLYNVHCHFCSKTYKEPYLLPCSHLLCKKCVEFLIYCQREIAQFHYSSWPITYECPVCRRKLPATKRSLTKDEIAENLINDIFAFELQVLIAEFETLNIDDRIYEDMEF